MSQLPPRRPLCRWMSRLPIRLPMTSGMCPWPPTGACGRRQMAAWSVGMSRAEPQRCIRPRMGYPPTVSSGLWSDRTGSCGRGDLDGSPVSTAPGPVSRRHAPKDRWPSAPTGRSGPRLGSVIWRVSTVRSGRRSRCLCRSTRALPCRGRRFLMWLWMEPYGREPTGVRESLRSTVPTGPITRATMVFPPR